MILTNKKFLTILIVAAIILSLFIFYIAQGQFGGASAPYFGGFVSNSFFCSCSGDFLITIGPPVGGQFKYQPGTPQYLYHRLPGSGMWALGLFSPGSSPCMVPDGKGCSPIAFPQGTITSIVGTSL